MVYSCHLILVTNASSNVLANEGQLYLNGSAVFVTCEFKEGIEGASCVLVYREYGNETLVVVEYPQNSTVFPVTLTVDGGLENYTFAVFGKHGPYLEERPIVMRHVQVIRTTPTATPSPPTAVTNSGIFFSTQIDILLTLLLVHNAH